MKLEVCVENIESALIAESNECSRIELCSTLSAGGITPSYGLISLCRKSIKIPIHVLIRPRGGDFLYSDLEFQIMKHDIMVCRDLGIDGVVFGILNADGSIDITRTRQLVEIAGTMAVTFHRAFDMSKDPFEALEDIISIKGIQRILTSGQEENVIKGLDLLKKLQAQSKDRIILMPGGGLRQDNVEFLIKNLCPKEIHMSCSKMLNSKMMFKNPKVFMGGIADSVEFQVRSIDSELVKKVLNNKK